MKKSSLLLWLVVALQVCAVLAAFGWRILRTPPRSDARVRAVYSDIFGGLKTTLDMFASDCGRYPSTAEGFHAMIDCPTNLSPQVKWQGPYFDPPQIPLDPWGHNYVYRCPGIHNTNSYDLYSVGPDGISKSGGEDPDDINNWHFIDSRAGNVSYRAPTFTINSIMMFALLGILLLYVACGIVSIKSPRVRDFFARNHTAVFVWRMTLLMALLVFLLYLLVPTVIS